MTVKELINELLEYNMDSEVSIYKYIMYKNDDQFAFDNSFEYFEVSDNRFNGFAGDVKICIFEEDDE